MKLLIATDAWHPQVNGVVQTLTMTAAALREMGVDVRFITPQSFRTVGMPFYPGIRLALPRPSQIARLIAADRPDAIHIATEGPIGLIARRYCQRHGLPVTTSFHTRFPEYVSARLPIPEAAVWSLLRWFHRPSRATMAATPALARCRCDAVPAAGEAESLSGSRFSVRRASGGGKESPRLSRTRSSRHEDRRRRRAGARGAAAGLSRCGFPRRTVRRGAGRHLCDGRRVRFPEHDRYVRPGAAGGAGLRRARRRVSCRRSARRDRRRTGGGARRRSPLGLSASPDALARSLPQLRAGARLGCVGPHIPEQCACGQPHDRHGSGGRTPRAPTRPPPPAARPGPPAARERSADGLPARGRAS
jgi:hypothetical protein